MLDVLAYATLATIILTTILAVARDLPILEAFGARRTPAGKWAGLLIGLIGIAAIILHWTTGATVGGIEPLAVVWPLALMYLWWTIAWRLRFAVLLLAMWPAPASAWNALGHRVIADIAWSELDDATRKHIVETLQRHPRYQEDFVQRRQETVDDEDRWTFGQAAVWADEIRGNKDYDNPTWHYVDFPVFVGPEREVAFNRSTVVEGDRTNWNVMQAIAYNREVVASDAIPAEKAVAYCWIFHLVGDLHQPNHSTALVSEKFADANLGDKGGNFILVTNGRNLHSLWDGFLGRRANAADVARAVAELEVHKDWWTVDTTIDVPAWVQESHRCAKEYVYSPQILTAAEGLGAWTPITLPEEYLKASGEHARQRVVAAGLRLAAVLADATNDPAKVPEQRRELPDVGG